MNRQKNLLIFQPTLFFGSFEEIDESPAEYSLIFHEEENSIDTNLYLLWEDS